MIKVQREEWGAREPKLVPLGKITEGVMIMWEGSDFGTFPHDSCATKVRGIQAYHMDMLQGNDVAFNHLVCPHGYVFVGRGHGVQHAVQEYPENELNCYFGKLSLQSMYSIKEILAETSEEVLMVNSKTLKWATPPELMEWLEVDMILPTPAYLAPLIVYLEDDMPAPNVVEVSGEPWVFIKGTYDAGMPPNCGQLFVNKTGLEDDWTNLGGEITSSPSAHVKMDGSIIVAARGKAGDIEVLEMSSDGTWGQWKSIGGRT